MSLSERTQPQEQRLGIGEQWFPYKTLNQTPDAASLYILGRNFVLQTGDLPDLSMTLGIGQSNLLEQAYPKLKGMPYFFIASQPGEIEQKGMVQTQRKPVISGGNVSYADEMNIDPANIDFLKRLRLIVQIPYRTRLLSEPASVLITQSDKSTQRILYFLHFSNSPHGFALLHDEDYASLPGLSVTFTVQRRPVPTTPFEDFVNSLNES